MEKLNGFYTGGFNVTLFSWNGKRSPIVKKFENLSLRHTKHRSRRKTANYPGSEFDLRSVGGENLFRFYEANFGMRVDNVKRWFEDVLWLLFANVGCGL